MKFMKTHQKDERGLNASQNDQLWLAAVNTVWIGFSVKRQEPTYLLELSEVWGFYVSIEIFWDCMFMKMKLLHYTRYEMWQTVYRQ